MVRAVIADRWSVLRSGVAAVLRACGVTTVAEAGTATAALGAIAPGGPELFVVGLVDDQPLVGAVRRAKAIDAAVGVIVLLPVVDREVVRALLEGGADAILTRTAGEDELRDAVLRTSRRERFIGPGLLAMLFGPAPAGAPPTGEATLLTERERRVLSLLVEGRSNREIADELYIGEATVKTHLHHVYEKLEVANRVQAIGRAIELRLVY